MTADENLKSTWSAVFRRKGGSGVHTRLWDEWDSETRRFAETMLEPKDDEMPVVLARTVLGGSVLLTTRRIVTDTVVAATSEITTVRPSEFSEKRKDELNELEVNLSNGKSILLVLEAGSSYFAIWSVLLHVSKKNTRRPQTS